MMDPDPLFGCFRLDDRVCAIRRMGPGELFEYLADLLEMKCECDLSLSDGAHYCAVVRLRSEVAGILRRGPWL
jgi:hypothetical protein